MDKMLERREDKEREREGIVKGRKGNWRGNGKEGRGRRGKRKRKE